MKVYVVLHNKGCHECAATVEGVFATEAAADAYVTSNKATLSGEWWLEDFDVQQTPDTETADGTE